MGKKGKNKKKNQDPVVKKEETKDEEVKEEAQVQKEALQVVQPEIPKPEESDPYQQALNELPPQYENMGEQSIEMTEEQLEQERKDKLFRELEQQYTNIEDLPTNENVILAEPIQPLVETQPDTVDTVETSHTIEEQNIVQLDEIANDTHLGDKELNSQLADNNTVEQVEQQIHALNEEVNHEALEEQVLPVMATTEEVIDQALDQKINHETLKEQVLPEMAVTEDVVDPIVDLQQEETGEVVEEIVEEKDEVFQETVELKDNKNYQLDSAELEIAETLDTQDIVESLDEPNYKNDIQQEQNSGEAVFEPMDSPMPINDQPDLLSFDTTEETLEKPNPIKKQNSNPYDEVKEEQNMQEVSLEEIKPKPILEEVKLQPMMEEIPIEKPKKAKKPKKKVPLPTPVPEEKPEPAPATSMWGGGVSGFWSAAPSLTSLASAAQNAKEALQKNAEAAAEQLAAIQAQKLEEQKLREKQARIEAKKQERLQKEKEEQNRIKAIQEEERLKEERIRVLKKQEEKKAKRAEELEIKQEKAKAAAEERQRVRVEEEKRLKEYQERKNEEAAKEQEFEAHKAKEEQAAAEEQRLIEQKMNEQKRLQELEIFEQQKLKEFTEKKEFEKQPAEMVQEINPLAVPKKTKSNISKAKSSASKSSLIKRDSVPNNLTKSSSRNDFSSNEQNLKQEDFNRMPLQPPPDNSDATSSVSFNTGVLYDQFDNMDSISQIDNGQSHTGSGIDLQNVGLEINKRDKKIMDLQSDRSKLKNLLKKAKSAIDSINKKYKSSQDDQKQAELQQQNAMGKNRELLQTLELVQKQRNGIDRLDVEEVLCRIRCNDIGYTLIKNINMECIWYQDSLIINIQEQMNKEWKNLKQVNYNTVFKQQQQTEDNLQACMQQYEERLKRVNEYMEQSNKSYLTAQEELQQLRQRHSKEMQERDNALSLLIEKSIDIKTNIQSIDEKAANQFSKSISRKSNIADLINDLEMQISNMINIPGVQSCKDQNVIEIKNHLIDLYQRVGVGLLKKHLVYQEKLQQSSNEWQETCDQLINEHQTLKEDRERSENDLQSRIKSTTDQLNQLKTEHYNVKKANEENSEKLKTEINNSLNNHYLKNVITSYFSTNDTTVQLSLMKVVFKVMKYTKEEQDQVLQVWGDNNKSITQWAFGM